MISLTAVLIILVTHLFADFVIQTDKQAKGKSHNILLLLDHTLLYSFIMGLASIFLLPIEKPVIGVYLSAAFFLITLVSHTVTDYFTSKLYEKLWAKGKTRQFFVSVGFDQLLHYIQLFVTLYYLQNI